MYIKSLRDLYRISFIIYRLLSVLYFSHLLFLSDHKFNNLIGSIYFRELLDSEKIQINLQLWKNEAANLQHQRYQKGSEKANQLILLESKNELVKEVNFLTILLVCFSILIVVIFLGWYFSYQNLKKRILKKRSLIAENNIEKIELTKKLNKNIEELQAFAMSNDELFITRFQAIYPDFSKRLLEINPKLALTEVQFCALLTFNFTSKEIAQFTFTSPKTVENKKTRIRKRLNIPIEKNLRLALKELM